MAALAMAEVAADPFTAMRALNRMRRAEFSLRLAGDSLQIAPIDRLTAEQRAYIRVHKPALVALLNDAETVYRALVEAGAAGLWWREGTPADWPDDRLLAAGEVLYGDGRMVNRMNRRYCSGSAPAFAETTRATAWENSPLLRPKIRRNRAQPSATTRNPAVVTLSCPQRTVGNRTR